LNLLLQILLLLLLLRSRRRQDAFPEAAQVVEALQ
jgi:hypothetical protein